MGKHQIINNVKNVMQIFLWLVFISLLTQSIRTVINLEALTDTRRWDAFAHIIAALFEPNLGDPEITRQVASKMWETIQIALLATTISTIIATPFSYLSVRPSSFWSSGFSVLVQPILSLTRSVHPLIIVIPVSVLAGIGPTAGVLTLSLFSTAVLIRNFSGHTQVYKSISWKAFIKADIPHLAFKQLPVNILIATILGFMGGGGIGFVLQQYLNLLNYHAASVAILACMIVIGPLDLLSWAVWRNFSNQ